jgi:hypothetical protein
VLNALVRQLPSLFTSALVFLCIAGCSTTRHGYPDQSMDTDAQIESFTDRFPFDTMIEDYYKLEGDEQRRKKRNEIINARMVLIDLHYAKFVQEFSGNRKDFETGADVTVLGLNTAGALFTPAGTVRVLSGVAGAVTGTRLAVDKNYFYEKTIPVLINAMNAQRTTVRARIERSINSNDAKYSLAQAWSDTTDYYLAGTFDGAIQSIQAKSGEQQQVADREIREIRTNAESTRLRNHIQKHFLSLSEPDQAEFMKKVGLLSKEMFGYEGRPAGFIQSATPQQLEQIRSLLDIAPLPESDGSGN